jgi:CMD domain protein
LSLNPSEAESVSTTSDNTAAPADDLIDRLAGLSPTSPLSMLRMQRPEAVKAIAASRAALFQPKDFGGISAAERAAVALRVATLDGNVALAGHYRRLLNAASGALDAKLIEAGSSAPGLPTELTAMLAHAEMLVTEPIGAGPAHLEALAKAGLSPRDIVVLSQLIAFVTFETRLLAGLRLLESAP